MSEQLRLCPCGLPAQSYTTESANGIIRYAIGCNDPLCQWTAGEYDTEAAAIAAWNQRAGEAERQNLLDRIENLAKADLRDMDTIASLRAELAKSQRDYAELSERVEQFRAEAEDVAEKREAELAALREDRDEAIGAALKVEQRNYDQAQEIKALRKLREACQTVVMDIGCTSFDDATVEAEVEQWYGRLKKALAACQKEMIDDRT